VGETGLRPINDLLAPRGRFRFDAVLLVQPRRNLVHHLFRNVDEHLLDAARDRHLAQFQ